jgi:hypothetical protein
MLTIHLLAAMARSRYSRQVSGVRSAQLSADHSLNLIREKSAKLWILRGQSLDDSAAAHLIRHRSVLPCFVVRP